MFKKSLIAPAYLKQGDKIGIVASARAVTYDEISRAVEILQSWGLEVILGKDMFQREDQFAGSDLQRAASLQELLDDPSIKAILFARGGYGSIRTLEYLDFRTFK